MIELQDIIQAYGDEYAEQHNLLPEQYKALRAIRDCRTAALGGHIDHLIADILMFPTTHSATATAQNVRLLQRSGG